MATPAEQVALINTHGSQHHEGVLKCRLQAGKGRVLEATRAFRQGELILIEGPLHAVQTESMCPAYRKLEQLCAAHEDDFDFEALWYWCALRSLTKEQLAGARSGGWGPVSVETQRMLLLLHREEKSLESSPGSSARILAKELAPAADPAVIEALTQAWVLNSFDYSDEPQGYCAYFFSSFMSHSCLPNAFWYYDGDNHVLRAREDIKVGDEVCISYLSEDWLLRSAPERRWDLHETKRFWCTCERCISKQDDSRGFLCQGCRKGIIFALTPGGGAQVSKRPSGADLVGLACDKCGRRIEAAEADRLTGYEKALEVLFEAFEQVPTASAAEELEALIDAVFVQHWLADQAWEQLVDFYGPHRRGDRLRLLRRRTTFASRAYPGLTGAQAWSVEALADDLRVALREEGEDAGLPAVVRLYTEARLALTLMYGPEHEYVAEIERKQAEARQAMPVELTPKRRRVSKKQSPCSC